MVFVTEGEKGQKCSETGGEVTQWDASSESFIRNQYYECMDHVHGLV